MQLCCIKKGQEKSMHALHMLFSGIRADIFINLLFQLMVYSKTLLWWHFVVNLLLWPIIIRLFLMFIFELFVHYFGIYQLTQAVLVQNSSSLFLIYFVPFFSGLYISDPK